MSITFPGIEFLRILLKKRKENSSSSTSSIKLQIRRFHFVVVHVKEMYWKAWCTCRAVVLNIKTIVFWSCHCRRRRSCLKVMLHGTIRNDDFLRNTVLQYWNNAATIRMSQQWCNAVLRWKSSLWIVSCNITLISINSPNEKAANTIEPDTAAVLLTTCWNAEDTYDGEHQNIDDRAFKEDQIQRDNEFTRSTGQAKEDGSTDSLFDWFPSETKTFVSFLWRWVVGQEKLTRFRIARSSSTCKALSAANFTPTGGILHNITRGTFQQVPTRRIRLSLVKCAHPDLRDL